MRLSFLLCCGMVSRRARAWRRALAWLVKTRAPRSDRELRQLALGRGVRPSPATPPKIDRAAQPWGCHSHRHRPPRRWRTEARPRWKAVTTPRTARPTRPISGCRPRRAEEEGCVPAAYSAAGRNGRAFRRPIAPAGRPKGSARKSTAKGPHRRAASAHVANLPGGPISTG